MSHPTLSLTKAITFPNPLFHNLIPNWTHHIPTCTRFHKFSLPDQLSNHVPFPLVFKVPSRQFMLPIEKPPKVSSCVFLNFLIDLLVPNLCSCLFDHSLWILFFGLSFWDFPSYWTQCFSNWLSPWIMCLDLSLCYSTLYRICGSA